MDLAASAPMRWQAIFEVDERAVILEAIDAILACPAVSLPVEAGNIVGGFAGLALWRAHLELTMPGNGHGEAARDLLDRASALMDERFPWLDSGFAGLAWMNSHFANELDRQRNNDSRDDPNEQVDVVLLQILTRSPWPGDVGLFLGLTGLGVYALERLPNPDAVAMLATIVARLDETAQRTDDGICWFRSPESLGPIARIAPRGFHDLGVAHGVPGIVALLAEICARGIEHDRARALLDGAIAWLMRQRRSGAGSWFPRWIEPGQPVADTPSCRAAWCTGDLGIAVVLYNAGARLDEPRWTAFALELARAAASRTLAESGVVDAGLCHGASGLAHMFNRLYQSSRDPLMRDAARAWFRQTLGMRRPRVGIAGFRTRMSSGQELD